VLKNHLTKLVVDDRAVEKLIRENRRLRENNDRLREQVEAAREFVADESPCDRTPLNSARQYWCSTHATYAPCRGEEAAGLLAALADEGKPDE
jgi:hypothetical protein